MGGPERTVESRRLGGVALLRRASEASGVLSGSGRDEAGPGTGTRPGLVRLLGASARAACRLPKRRARSSRSAVLET